MVIMSYMSDFWQHLQWPCSMLRQTDVKTPALVVRASTFAWTHKPLCQAQDAYVNMQTNRLLKLPLISFYQLGATGLSSPPTSFTRMMASKTVSQWTLSHLAPSATSCATSALDGSSATLLLEGTLVYQAAMAWPASMVRILCRISVTTGSQLEQDMIAYCALRPTLAASTKLMCIFQLDNKKHAKRRTLFENGEMAVTLTTAALSGSGFGSLRCET